MGCKKLTYHTTEKPSPLRVGYCSREQKESRENPETIVEARLYYYGARYYNPSTSVWLSVDAMANQRPDLSPYNFVSNNPIMRVDPDGNLDWSWAKGACNWVGNQVSNIKNGVAKMINGQKPEELEEIVLIGEKVEIAQKSNSMPSKNDIVLAAIGTTAATIEEPAKKIMNSRSGYTSGKINENSPRIYSKAKATKYYYGAKSVGWLLTVYGVISTELDYANGKIDDGMRAQNQLNNTVSVFFPRLAVPIAAGTYGGQRYSKEIEREAVQPGGVLFETTKYVLEIFGLATKPD